MPFLVLYTVFLYPMNDEDNLPQSRSVGTRHFGIYFLLQFCFLGVSRKDFFARFCEKLFKGSYKN